ncbi:MAG: dienelactone hydrolase family protein, partial [Bdellovibrionales bacterium]|nr:dienelactone hydrolase family protein [Oligoflexia bacterium]
MTKIKLSDGTEMQIYIARGASAKKLPGIILIQEAFGVNTHIRSVADRIALEGYVVYAPEIYHHSAGDNFTCAYTEFQTKAMPHYEAVTRETLDVDLKGTHEALCADPAVDASKIGCIGFCLGGRVTFYANSILPLQCAVSFYGGGIDPEMLDCADKQSGPIFLAWGGKDKHIPVSSRKKISGALSRAKKPFIEIAFADADHGFFCEERASYHADSA